MLAKAQDDMNQQTKNDQTVSALAGLFGGGVICIIIIIIIIMISMSKKKDSGGVSAVPPQTGAPGVKAANANQAGVLSQGFAAIGQSKGANLKGDWRARLAQVGKSFYAPKGVQQGGGRKQLAKLFQGLPLIVILILVLVWYAKRTEQKELVEQV
jgi:hypothetical protein